MKIILNKKAKILLMFNYEAIVICTENLLKYFGYDVQICSNKNRLFALYQNALAEKDFFNIVILDLDIVNASEKKELFSKLLKLDPKVKVIIVTNRVTDLLLDYYRKYQLRGIITKPFAINEVLNMVDQVCNLL